MKQTQLKQWVMRVDSITKEFSPRFKKAQIWQCFTEGYIDESFATATNAKTTVNTTRLKYRVGERFPNATPEAIAMWIADMDTHPLTSIAESCSRFLMHNFGYQEIEVGPVVSKWFDKYGVRVMPASVIGVASVISGVDIALSLLTQPGDKAILLSPTYGPLRDRILAHKLSLIDIPLSTLASSQPIDIAQLADHLDSDAKVLLVCHPNNPTGTILAPCVQRVIASFCDTHGITIISDEVHSEFGYLKNAPKQSISPFAYGYAKEHVDVDEIESFERSNHGCLKSANHGCLKSANHGCLKSANHGCLKNGIHFNSVSKAFNLAAIPGASYAVIENETLRHRFKQEISRRHLEASPISVVALKEAYQHGLPWLNRVKEAIYINRQYTHALLQELPCEVPYSMGEAGYFLWLDLRSHFPVDSFRAACERGVIGVDGAQFNAPGFIRLNLACHPALIAKALKRLFA